jgi:hypothetical protein
VYFVSSLFCIITTIIWGNHVVERLLIALRIPVDG